MLQESLVMCVAKVYLLLASVLVPALCFNHWVVTEDGKIEYQVSSFVASLYIVYK